ncbi:hypothetical protein [Pseudomarimonas arenosa]|uniref:Uncharacterized protein n=1 Tax=Pseudomarimonas arenosa TaxID=2774145 RepID=A0AAW3ZTT9_9GAMM|nr:hypothetical protein [Pseudomarimonas arenosa]MBD8528339.1 hypothetical protein [Pseudomarimonas arenosa]
MNTITKLIVSAMIASGCSAAASAAVPVHAGIDTSSLQEGAVVGGVLGYGPECQLALFPSREAAANRDMRAAMPLHSGSNSIELGHGVEARNVIGRYVLAQRSMSLQSEGGAASAEGSVYYLFGKPGGAVECVLESSVRRIPLNVVLSDTFDTSESVEVVGWLGLHNGGMVLYTNRESAENNFWIASVPLAGPKLGTPGILPAWKELQPSVNSYIAVTGRIERTNGSGGFTRLMRVDSIRIVESP